MGDFQCGRSRSTTPTASIYRANFLNQLNDILQSHQNIAANLETSTFEQITESMIDTRRLTPEERMTCYVKNRIENQQIWYSNKSEASKKALNR